MPMVKYRSHGLVVVLRRQWLKKTRKAGFIGAMNDKLCLKLGRLMPWNGYGEQ